MKEDKSKSQSRRDALALKAFGEKLLALSPKQLATLDLPEQIKEVVIAYRKMKSHLAQKRHIQYLGNCLRHLDEDEVDSIMLMYEKMMSSADLHSPRFKLIESWRERLITEDNVALTEFLAQYPCDNVQHLRHLIRKAKMDANNESKLVPVPYCFVLFES